MPNSAVVAPARRFLVAIIGEAAARPDEAAWQMAAETGERLVDANCRVCGGGLGGVMHAAFAGAKRSQKYREGDTLAILPTLNAAHANDCADIVLPTGLGHIRNGIVAAADAVVVAGGKAGTLSEMSLAWRYNRLIVALTKTGGVAAQFAGKALDNREHRRQHPALATVAAANTPQEAADIIVQNLPACYLPTADFSA